MASKNVRAGHRSSSHFGRMDYRPGMLRHKPLALALAGSLAAVGVGGVWCQPVCAATPARAVQSAHYSIAPGDLGRALDALSRQGGLHLDYAPALVAGKTTGGLSGNFAAAEALHVLLRHTGLLPRRIDDTTFVIAPDPGRDPHDPSSQATTPPPPPETPEPTSKPKPKPKPETLQTVTVTGSLIPQSQVQTFVPTITLHPEQLENSGFGSVYTALRAQPLATGSVEDNQAAGANGFTPGAETVSLLGLDPGFTLYLIDGHPVTSYPLLYQGQSNFVDIGDIPMGMVERIDIVPGNLSSIYGSSAIAGVINVVLKQHMDGYELNVRTGGYTQGGGQNERVEFVGGLNKDKLSMIYGLQVNHQNPIWGYQRSLTASSLANPDPALRYGRDNFVYEYLTPGGYSVYVDPGDQCNAVSGLYRGTTKRWSKPNLGPPFDPATGAPTGPGYYCGSPDTFGWDTVLNKVRSGAGYLNVKYRINDDAELYANVLYNVSMNHAMYGFQYWEPNLNGNGLFWNQSTGRYESLWRYFSPEETGTWDANSETFLERTYNMWSGVRGNLSNLHYDVFFSRSQQTLDEKIPWLLTDKVNAFFQNSVMGPQLGTTSGYPIYNPNIANLYKPVTPAEYASFNGVQRDHNVTWIQSANIQVSDGNLFSLPGGQAGFAGVFQYGEQVWSNPTDPRVLAGDFYGLTGTSGGGARNFWAFGGEFRAPLFKMLTADLSARYDQYSNHGGGVDGRATYRLGLEFRPFSSLLIRGNYATAFRAPDMAYVFGGKSGSFPGGFTDYYRCDQFGGPVVDCPFYNDQSFFQIHTGNRQLKSITAKSYGFGAVWSPTDDFDAKVDYYNIDIANEVELQSADALLKEEAACRTGQLNIDSPTCVATLAQIERALPTAPEPNELLQITVLPVNIARERVSGIMASLDYSLGLGKFGSLKFTAAYNVTLKHSFQPSAGDPSVNLLTQPQLYPYSTEFKTIANASVTWGIGKWSTTLYGTRYGKSANWAAQFNGYGTDLAGFNGQPAGSVPPWMLYNGSVTYHVTPQLRVSAIVNNLLNKMPPTDLSYVDWPYYNSDNYNPYGRQLWIELDWRFGQQ